MSSATPPTTASDRLVHLRPPRHTIEKRAVWWWTIRALVTWGAGLAALVAVAVLWEASRPWMAAPIALLSVVLAAKTLVEPWWRYRVHRWEIGEHATYARSGWIVQEWRVAPSSRIQTVDAVRGPIEQMLGLATLRVTTASSYGAISVPGLDGATADAAVKKLAEVAEITPGDAT
ncbi:MAG: PH domain-containing protein [Demequina sp.]